mgnify:CR=1 FL=1
MLKFINFLAKNAFKLFLVWVIVLSIFYSTLSVLRHNHFQSGGFDLGLYDQAVWQYSRFFEPYNTIKERHILGDHLNLTLPLLAPLFWLWDNVRMLLIFQAFWISFSSLAIYKLCRLRKFSPLTSLNLSFIYSLFYGIQQAVFFDFHPVVIGVGLLAWVAYFLESGKTKPFIITLILLLATQENMGIALACLGLIYLFQKKYRRIALGFIIGGFGWSFLAAKVIASFSNVGFQYWPEISLNPVKIAVDFFNSQEKRLTWLYSLSWFSFLPLLSPGVMLAVLLDLSQYFVTGKEFARMWSPFMHHRVILAPFLLLGMLDALKLLNKIKPLNQKVFSQTISLFLVLVALSLQYFFHFPLNKLSKPIYWREEPWMADNRGLFKSIPPEASVATQQSLAPHLSHRKEIYLVYPRQHDFDNKPCGQISCWWLDFGGKPEYLVVDLHPYQWLTQLLESNENFESAIKNMEKAGKIRLEKEVNDAKLYRIIY